MSFVNSMKQETKNEKQEIWDFRGGPVA